MVNFFDSWWNYYVLMTTANNPDVMYVFFLKFLKKRREMVSRTDLVTTTGWLCVLCRSIQQALLANFQK